MQIFQVDFLATQKSLRGHARKKMSNITHRRYQGNKQFYIYFTGPDKMHISARNTHQTL